MPKSEPPLKPQVTVNITNAPEDAVVDVNVDFSKDNLATKKPKSLREWAGWSVVVVKDWWSSGG